MLFSNQSASAEKCTTGSLKFSIVKIFESNERSDDTYVDLYDFFKKKS